jgi:hypothetical protein
MEEEAEQNPILEDVKIRVAVRVRPFNVVGGVKN